MLSLDSLESDQLFWLAIVVVVVVIIFSVLVCYLFDRATDVYWTPLDNGKEKSDEEKS